MAASNNIASTSNARVQTLVKPINMKEVDIVKVDLLPDGRREVAFYGYDNNGVLSTMRVTGVEKNAPLRYVVRGSHPEWMFFDCRVGGIMQLGGFWVMDRKNVSLNHIEEDYEDNVGFLGDITGLELEDDTTLVDLGNILPLLPNILIDLTIRTKTICCDEDLKKLSTFRHLKNIDIVVAEDSNISYDEILKLIQTSSQLAKICLRQFRGTRKSMIGALHRAENIETFEFNQNFITIHRNDGSSVVLDFGRFLP